VSASTVEAQHFFAGTKLVQIKPLLKTRGPTLIPTRFRALIVPFVIVCCGEASTAPPTPTDPADNQSTAPLELLSISPKSGHLSGGDIITCTGEGFRDGMRVRFGARDATSVKVVDSKTAEVITPASDATGVVTVVVDASDDLASLPNAFTYLETGGIARCTLETDSVAATTGAPSEEIVVTFETISPPEAVEVHVGYGNGFGWQAYTFQELVTDTSDVSTLQKTGSIVGAPEGIFDLVARTRLAGSPTWLYCDTDGSENGIDAEHLGTFEVVSETPTISFCRLETEGPVTATAGQRSNEITGIVYSDGITDSSGHGAQIMGQIGVAERGTPLEDYAYYDLFYREDSDGLEPGDHANDRYGAGLQQANSGEYLFHLRFRVGEDDWTLCDLDDNTAEFSIEKQGVLLVSDPPEPTIGFCQTEAAGGPSVVSEPVEVEASVYAAGITNGPGRGEGLEAQLVWGPANEDAGTWTQNVAASYVKDVDALSSGVLAYDRYRATFVPDQPGDVGFVFRFRPNGTSVWAYCDTDGSDGTENGFQSDRIGVRAVTSQAVPLPDACHLQHPHIVIAQGSGEDLLVYGRVREPGMTAQGGPAAGLLSQLVVGPPGLDPSVDLTPFTLVDAAYNPQATDLGADEDEYRATWSATQPGQQAYAFRFSVDNGTNWKFCDLDGASFSPSKMGSTFVQSQAVDPVDFCHVWQQSLSAAIGSPPPLVTVELYEDPDTVNNQGANQATIEAQVGWGTPGTNPALPGVYTWNQTLLPFKGLRAGHPNNYEYEGPVSDQTLTVSNAQVTVRVRKIGKVWRYCDTADMSNDFRVDLTTYLTVTP
jgi:hypothetical protein